jgi:hypothetical protein
MLHGFFVAANKIRKVLMPGFEEIQMTNYGCGRISPASVIEIGCIELIIKSTYSQRYIAFEHCWFLIKSN